jgi:hypothetical protein
MGPKLGPLADNGGPTPTMALLPGSPANNAGALAPGITTDQRGVSRLAYGSRHRRLRDRPPNDITPGVSIAPGGFRYDRATHHFIQSVTITNTSGSAFVGPLALVLDGLTSGVTLVNASGTTSAANPSGSPYLSIPFATPLQPGQSVTVLLVFDDPTLVQIRYTPRLLQGPSSS